MAEREYIKEEGMGAERNKDSFSRRRFLEISSAALATAGVVPAASALPQAQQDVEKTKHDRSSSSPMGPKNQALHDQNPDSVLPPDTDHSNVQPFKYPFSYSHKRLEEGGWARQVTVQDLPVSTTIAGVNMRLTAGGIRELHWHAAAEWAYMLYGTARITGFDYDGKPFVDDVGAGDLWYFPTGMPHSIQGLAPDGCEFLLVFDDGAFSEYDTVLLDDWLGHTPHEVRAKNFGVSEQALAGIPDHELYIFQGEVPGPLERDKEMAGRGRGLSPINFSFRPSQIPATHKSKSGEVKIVDSTVFKVSKTIAAALVTVRPGGMRELHWHPNADEWQYYIKGQGRMTVFAAGGRARTMDFQTGDVGYVQYTLAHYIENTGDSDLQFLEMFRSDHYADFSLNNWITHLPPELVMAHLHISRETLDAIPHEEFVVVPG
jgi:oxalate decarboxylase